MKAMMDAMTARGRANTVIEATATDRETGETTVTAATSSASVLHDGAQPPLAAPVHILIPAPAPVHHPPLPLPPKTKPSRISHRQVCSRLRRTRSGRRTERARCSSIMSRLRLASRLLGGGFMFLRVMSKSVRFSPPCFFFLFPTSALAADAHPLLLTMRFCGSRRFAPYTPPKCVSHRS